MTGDALKKPVPAVAVVGAATLNDEAAAEFTTVTLPLVPLTEPEVAVNLTLSRLSSVTLTVAVPLTKGYGGGHDVVWLSLAVSVTWPL